MSKWNRKFVKQLSSVSFKEKIIASADGVIEKVYIGKKGYHGKEDVVIINHGDILSDRILTHYTHMMPYASEELKEKTKRKKIIRRGDIIGQGTAHFKIFMYRAGLIGDMDNYGHRMGYMEYWDGKTELDYPLKLVKEKIEFK